MSPPDIAAAESASDRYDEAYRRSRLTGTTYLRALQRLGPRHPLTHHLERQYYDAMTALDAAFDETGAMTMDHLRALWLEPPPDDGLADIDPDATEQVTP